MSTPTVPADQAGGARRERVRRLRAELRHWRVIDLIGVAAAWAVVMATRGLRRSHRLEKSHPATPVTSAGAAASSHTAPLCS